MEEQKSFWRKNEKLIVVIATLVVVYVLVISNQKINFLFGNELIVSLNPAQKSSKVYYGNKTSVEFNVSVQNFAQCRTACRYKFIDRSRSETLDDGNFELAAGRHFGKDYNLSAKRAGRGQDIYGFEVKCHSIWTLLCLTNQPEIARTSFITVNYDLTDEEKRLKENLGKDVKALLFALADADIGLQKLNQKYFELAHHANLNNLSKQKIDINGKYDDIAIAVENLRSLWAVENYAKLSLLFNESFLAEVNEIKKLISSLSSQIDSIVELHNSIQKDLENLSKESGELENFVNMLERDEYSYDLHLLSNKLKSAAEELHNNTFDNYTLLINGVSVLSSQQKSLSEKTEVPSGRLYFEISYAKKLDDDVLCSLRQDCKEDISISNAINDTEKFLKNYPDSSQIKSVCTDILNLEYEYSKTRSEASVIIANKSIGFPAEERFINATEKFKYNIIRDINNSYYESFEEIKAKNNSNKTINITQPVLPKNKTGFVQLDYNESFNLSLYLLSKIALSDQQQDIIGKCLKLGQKPTIEIPKFERVIPNISYDIKPKIDTMLSDNPPICCVFNECNPCCADESCRNDPKTFPVIFIHGHSLAKENSPEYSLDSFNKLQSRLQEDGYLNAGIVSLYSKNEPGGSGTWSMSGKPVTVKASYYYDAFRKNDKYIVVPTKSENIDTYAIRLKEIIEIVKGRTNKPKVNIVAHSMGGLVARRYMQIFGDNGVHKLIMIATPNKGIKGDAADYCGVIGENRECQDMLENSLFLNKLNDPLEQPSSAKIYAIIGQGCPMDSNDGDGIVLSENAKTENTKLLYVKGSCGGLFRKYLHTEILNIDAYPETYNIVKEALRE
ncbi:alpha/beta hydrolase [Candidatus Woesearchaeota archaeon]|nr:alpha/beta hydrolase [Candidatus Woesearchaeota archaeon]